MSLPKVAVVWSAVALHVAAITPACNARARAVEPVQLAQKEKKDKTSGKLTFEVYTDAKKQWRWRLLAANGENLATSGQGYKQKESCSSAIDRIKSDAGMLDFEVYQDKSQQFRWRLIAANGQTIGQSSQGYKAKADCQHAIDVIKAGAAKAEVREEKKSD